MGAWGPGIFENDDAMDWAVDFQHEPSEQSLREAFEAAVAVDDYLERDLGSYALDQYTNVKSVWIALGK